MQNNEIVDKSQMLLDKIQKLLDQKVIQQEESKLMLEASQTTEMHVDDIAIIEAFYGVDIDRINATTQAIKSLLKSKVVPSEWFFIEAQTSRNLACFQWLQIYGINYIFQEIGPQQEGIFLKTPLWNIGAMKSKASKLCFIDSDVMFKSRNWLQEAASQLGLYDVLSLSETCTYQNEDRAPQNSIGKNVVLAKGKSLQKMTHCGFTFGCTRKAYQQMNAFDCNIILDDIQTWTKILGNEMTKAAEKWQSFKTDEKFEDGMPFNVGFISGECVHLFHGQAAERHYAQLVDIVKGNAARDELFEYDPMRPEELPRWKDTTVAAAVKLAIHDMKTADASMSGRQLWHNAAEKCLETIDIGHPLIICTAFKNSYLHNSRHLKDFYSKLQESCDQDFTFVCFTDCDDISAEIDCIPLDESYSKHEPWKQCLREDVEFPKDATVVFIDIDHAFSEKLHFYRSKALYTLQ